mgnify:CR=1 FL=1
MIDKAITFATKAHEGQFRKGTKLPYIVHPLEVGVIVSRMTQDKEVIAAAILHDTLEDCKEVTFSTLCQEFGERVAEIVKAESEEKGGSWNERKANTVKRLKEEKASDMKLVALGDKLWERFNMKDKRQQAWYYRGLCDSLKDMENFPEYWEFCELIAYVFRGVVVD